MVHLQLFLEFYDDTSLHQLVLYCLTRITFPGEVLEEKVPHPLGRYQLQMECVAERFSVVSFGTQVPGLQVDDLVVQQDKNGNSALELANFFIVLFCQILYCVGRHDCGSAGFWSWFLVVNCVEADRRTVHELTDVQYMYDERVAI